MRRQTTVFVLFAATSTLASQQGQPLDCSDWQYSEPGMSCENVSNFPCAEDEFACTLDWERSPLSVEGTFYEMRLVRSIAPPCYPGAALAPEAVEILRRDRYGTATVIARIEDRCDGPNLDRVETCAGTAMDRPPCLVFDPHNGVLYARVQVSQWGPSTTYPWGYRVLAIGGLTTTFDLQQTFAPDKQRLGLHVPARPEGLSAATRFDSYWGTVTQPLSLANAHPLQCSYPTTQPSVGAHFQITAPIPIPAPGHANYILTSVTYQGQTRAGRKASGGRLTGRDASQLPACVPPPTPPKRS